MKKVTAFVGSPRKKHTHDAVRQFLGVLESLGGVESEIVALGDCRLESCRGCCTCFTKGEESCPVKDDRDALIARIMVSDGVVYTHYRDKGWFESDYYHPVRLNLFKKATGSLFDYVASRSARE